VELLVLVERKYTRELPVEGQYVGLAVNTIRSERVFVQWANDQEHTSNDVWLLSNSDDLEKQ